jgi:integrase
MVDLVADFLDFAKKTKSPSDYASYRIACNALLRYADMLTADFDAFLLREVQAGFVNADYVRTYCNKLVNLTIYIFRWGETRRLVPAGKAAHLRAIEPLRVGMARESDFRYDVPDEVVERTLPFLLPTYQAIVRMVQGTGARPSEILRMKVGDIVRNCVESGGVSGENGTENVENWVYKPKFHKTTRHNKCRIIFFGAKEQVILTPYLDKKPPESAIFSPKTAIFEHKTALHLGRKTKRPPSQVARDKERKRHPKAKYNEHFTTAAVGLALRKAIKAANKTLPADQQIPYWTLYQLRHAFATKAVESLGEDKAALLMGHSDPKMLRERYDHSKERRAAEYRKQLDRKLAGK